MVLKCRPVSHVKQFLPFSCQRRQPASTLVGASIWGPYYFSYHHGNRASLHHSLLWPLVDFAMGTTLAAWCLVCEITFQCPALLGMRTGVSRSSDSPEPEAFAESGKYTDEKSPDHSYSYLFDCILCCFHLQLLSASWFDHIYYLWLSLARIELYFLCHS